MSISANARVEARDAPGGLVLVQELLNTAAGGVRTHARPDLLLDPETAQEWVDGRFAEGDPRTARLEVADLERLRALRARIRASVFVDAPMVDDDGGAHDALVRLRPAVDGSIELVPEPGAAGIAAAVLTEVLLAQHDERWPRVKVCGLAVCGTVFYDRSKNVSARYHSAWCANHVNLRNSRERHRPQ